MTDVVSRGYTVLTIKEGEAPFLMARVTNKAGTIIAAADVSTVKATITNATLGTTILNESTLTKADVWFSTYQTGAEWTADSTGYNFGWQTLATYFTSTTWASSARFLVEIWVTPVSGQPFQAGWWEISVLPSIVPVA